MNTYVLLREWNTAKRTNRIVAGTFASKRDAAIYRKTLLEEHDLPPGEIHVVLYREVES